MVADGTDDAAALSDRRLPLCRSSLARSDTAGLWSCRFPHAVFTHDPVLSPCSCPATVLPFQLGHMICCPLRAHYFTSVQQQQRDRRPCIKRISMSSVLLCGSFAPIISTEKKKNLNKMIINVAISNKTKSDASRSTFLRLLEPPSTFFEGDHPLWLPH